MVRQRQMYACEVPRWVSVTDWTRRNLETGPRRRKNHGRITERMTKQGRQRRICNIAHNRPKNYTYWTTQATETTWEDRLGRTLKEGLAYKDHSHYL